MKVERNLVIAIAFLLMIRCGEKEVDIPRQNATKIFSDGVINDEVSGVPIVVYGNRAQNFFSVYKRMDEDGNVYQFERSEFSFPDVLKNVDGESWNAFGKNSDRKQGKALRMVDNLVGYWFAFPSFHKKIILQDGSEIVNPDFNSEDASSEWRIDEKFVFAGSIKDGIKSIDNPHFIKATSKEFIENEFYKMLGGDELLTFVQIDNDVHVYPHRIMEYHEVVNDIIGGREVTISFCPLTGTSRAWERKFDGIVHEFGVSGLLYNNNLILYDRTSGSNWVQIMNQSVNGSQAGRPISPINVWEVKVENLLEISGAIKVLTTDTGIKYDYQYPVYGDYKYSDRISFPLTFSDDRIPPKERVLAVTVGDVTKVYRFSDFEQ